MCSEMIHQLQETSKNKSFFLPRCETCTESSVSGHNVSVCVSVQGTGTYDWRGVVMRLHLLSLLTACCHDLGEGNKMSHGTGLPQRLI